MSEAHALLYQSMHGGGAVRDGVRYTFRMISSVSELILEDNDPAVE